MPRPQRHVILSQEFEIRLADESGATGLHQLIGRLSQGPLAALLDRYCSLHSSPEQVHRIDSLELDLGKLPASSLESVLVARFEAALAAQLPALIQSAEQTDPGAVRDRKRSELELLAFLLETGALPWWADARQPALLGDSLRRLIRHDPARLRSLLLELLKKLPARQRLASQLDSAGFAALARLLLPPRRRHKSQLAAVPDRLAPLLARATGQSERHTRQRLREELLVWSISLPAQAQVVPATAFFQKISELFDLSLDRLVAAFQQTWAAAGEQPPANWTALLRQLQTAWRDEQQNRGTAPKPSSRRPAAKKTTAQAAGKDLDPADQASDLTQTGSVQGVLLGQKERKTGHQDAQVPPSPTERPVRRDAARRNVPFSDAEELFLDHAGLVVLGPFLPHFFRALGLIEHNDWVDEGAPHRGVAALHFLLTGQEDMPEYQTPLLKVCCGITPEEPLEYGEPLAETLKAECANFLSSVIAHAPALNNMSLDGFRGTFLLRPGTLGQRDGHWLVRVERQAYDVVLDRFPWSFRLIRLPWLSRLIGVEW